MATLQPGGKSSGNIALKSLAALFLVLSSFIVSGCAPADPLDHRVKAATPSAFSDWWDEVKDDLSDDQRTEAYRLIRYLQESTPRLRSMRADDTHDPLCKRIDRLRLRDIMVLAYEDKNDSLRSKVLVETGRLPALVENSSTSEGEARQYLQSRIEYSRSLIDEYNKQIANNDRRIAELRPSAR